MKRRTVLIYALGSLALPALPRSLLATFQPFHAVARTDWDLTPLARDADAWRDHLNDDAWQILFRDETEPRHASPLNDETADGTYICAACHLPLFSSDAKYDSGTGWPSFYAPYRGHVDTRADTRLWRERTEYHCIRCKGHQGHVFEDGPPPTGQRWCNNGLALRFVPADEPLPDARG